ncbi:unnamed protein product [Prorocentrum cordatum]|uniref:Uncharacterized protein n=1 Tax=Prorocentrum cordatum TaxID=2364126 RepID=A0ABN9QW07_9DINO|nr:unnamed protein product [Polarella glacialis]
MSLTREDFGQVCKDHPENREQLRRHFVRYAVIRGIIVYAQQRRERTMQAMQKHVPSLVSHESHGAEQYNHHVRRARHELTKKTLEWKGNVDSLEATGSTDGLCIEQRIPSLRRGLPQRLSPRGAAAAVPPLLLGRECSIGRQCSLRSLHSSHTAMAHLPSIMEPKAAPRGPADDDAEASRASPPGPLRRAGEPPEPDGAAGPSSARARRLCGRAPLEAVEDRLTQRIEALAQQVSQLQASVQLLVAQGAGVPPPGPRDACRHPLQQGPDACPLPGPTAGAPESCRGGGSEEELCIAV